MKATQQLHDLGQSLWLDNITRDLLDSGTLKTLHRRALGHRLDLEPDHLRSRHDSRAIPTTTKSAKLMSEAACRVKMPSSRWRSKICAARPTCSLRIHQRTSTVDGWVSLEVSPLLAYDAKTTVQVAKALHQKAARPNLFIKIPGTPEGRTAIEEAIFAGVSVNVTLLFSREHYLGAAEAYMRGLERRVDAGLSPDVRSVASLFVSRWDKATMEKVPGRSARQARAGHRRSRLTRPIATCWTPIAGSAWRTWARGRSGCCSPAPEPKIPRPPTCSTSARWLRPTRSTPCRKKLCWPSAAWECR